MVEDFVSVFWAWNGELDKKTIKKQLTDFYAKGITDVFVHARAGLKVEYMGEEWMDAFAYSLTVAQNVGIRMWIYDENGWPSGFAGGKVYSENEEYKEKYLLKTTTEFSGFIAAGIEEKDIYAVYDVSGESPVKVPLTIARKGGVFDFIYIVTNNYYVDITNPDAINCFIKHTHEKYKARFANYFGNVIPGMFTDEPHVSPHGVPYGKYIVAEYENIYGGDFSYAVENLFYDKVGCELFRYRYRKVLNKLIKENYARRYGEWCKQNGLIFTGHFASEEGLASLVASEGSVMPYFTEMGLIGIDALGNRLVPTVVYKQAESVSRQFGNGKVLCETYAGSGYDCTFKELLRIWAFQAIHGVTHLCASISMSSIEGNRKRDYPQFFSEQMPWWDKSDKLFSEIKNINRNLAGERVTDTIVVFPVSGTFCLYGAKIDDRVLEQSTAFRNLTENLTATQVDFDYGDESMISEQAFIENGKFALGKMRYDRVIVAQSPNIESGVLIKLREFSKAGGEVLFVGDLPFLIDGENEKPKIDFPYIALANRRDFIRKYFQSKKVCDCLIYEPEERKISEKFETAKRIISGGVRLAVLNKDRNGRVFGRIIASGKKYITVSDGDTVKPLFGIFNEARNESEFPVSLNAMEYAFYDVKDGEPFSVKDEILASDTVIPFNATCTNNTFSVDKASLSVNGAEYDKEEYVIYKTEKLYAAINGMGKADVLIKYTFNVEDFFGVIFACCETGGGRAFLNGTEIFPIGKAFYDEAEKFDISGLIKRGENEFVLSPVIPAYYNEFFGKEVYQSVMNVFSFPFYAESLILEGNFTVKCDVSGRSATYITCKGGFSLCEPKPLVAGDLSEKDMPFFSGVVIAEYNIEKRNGFDITILSVENTFAVYSAIIADGEEIPITAGNRIDVSDKMRKGDLAVKIVMYSSLRNLFGPHHHIYGKHYYTGPSVFEGYAEWQDAVVYPELKGKTYVEDYSFTRFVLPRITVSYGIKRGV